MQSQGCSKKAHGMAFVKGCRSMQIERGPGRGISQAPPGLGWAGKRPKICDFVSYLPPKQKQKQVVTALEIIFCCHVTVLELRLPPRGLGVREKTSGSVGMFRPRGEHAPHGIVVEISAELKRAGKLLRIRPGIFDFGSDSGLKLGQTKPKISGTVPTNRHTTIANDYEPISACFDHDPKPLNCELAQPRDFDGQNTKI